MIDYETLGRRIRAFREQKQLTQEQLAEKINVSVPYISFIEHAKKKPSLEVLTAIADVLEVNVDALLTDNRKDDPLSDISELLYGCSSVEKQMIYELSMDLIKLLRKNR